MTHKYETILKIRVTKLTQFFFYYYYEEVKSLLFRGLCSYLEAYEHLKLTVPNVSGKYLFWFMDTMCSVKCGCASKKMFQKFFGNWKFFFDLSFKFNSIIDSRAVRNDCTLYLAVTFKELPNAYPASLST